MVNRILHKLDEYLSHNDYDSAKRHLHYWKEEAKASQNEQISLLVHNELMGLCRKLGEKEQALTYAKEALQTVERMNIAENTGAATTYLNVATVYKAFDMAKEALPLYEKALKIYEDSLEKNDSRFSGLYNNMALALVDVKRFEEAKKLYSKALQILQFHPGSEPEQAITYLNLANAAETELGAEASENIINTYLEQAMQLLNISESETDGNYAFVCEKCAPVFGYFGYFYFENELKMRARRIYERA